MHFVSNIKVEIRVYLGILEMFNKFANIANMLIHFIEKNFIDYDHIVDLKVNILDISLYS